MLLARRIIVSLPVELSSLSQNQNFYTTTVWNKFVDANVCGYRHSLEKGIHMQYSFANDKTFKRKWWLGLIKKKRSTSCRFIWGNGAANQTKMAIKHGRRNEKLWASTCWPIWAKREMAEVWRESWKSCKSILTARKS